MRSPSSAVFILLWAVVRRLSSIFRRRRPLKTFHHPPGQFPIRRLDDCPCDFKRGSPCIFGDQFQAVLEVPEFFAENCAHGFVLYGAQFHEQVHGLVAEDQVQGVLLLKAAREFSHFRF